jgi:hypothetical protein
MADVVAVADHVRDYTAAHGERGPVAMVTRNIEMLGAGQIYAFQGAKRGYSVELFWDVPEAEGWLDQQARQ